MSVIIFDLVNIIKHWTAEYSCLADILEGKSTDIGKTCSGCVGKVMSNFKSDFKNV